MAIKCNNIDKLKEILSETASETNEIGGDSRQIDYKIQETIVSLDEGTGSVVFRGKKSNCDIQKSIENKIKAINELSIPIQCSSK
jgi:hypothetical protein